jgi:1,4-dihydroxy-2-naphthoyl-CoA hydrolase
MTDTTDAPDGGSPAPDYLAEVQRMMDMNGRSLNHRMGIRYVEAAPERVVATMPVEGNTQPYGLLHGGASVVLAESLGSTGAALHAGPGRAVVGLDINATHHRAARSGLVTGTATALSLGRTLASYEVVVTDEDGRRICTSRITCLIRDAAPGAR